MTRRALIIIFFLWIGQCVIPGIDDGYDFRALWSASKVFYAGGNPYDRHALGEVLGKVPDSFLNPPHTLILLGWLSLFPFEIAEWLWRISSALCLILIVPLTLPAMSENIPGEKKGILYRAEFWLIALVASIVPVAICLRVGQVSPIIALGVGFISRWILEDKTKISVGWILAGLLFTSIKPHLIFLIYPILLVQFLYATRPIRNIFLVSISFILFILSPLLISSDIFHLYFNQSRPRSFSLFLPTIPSLLIAAGVPQMFAWMFGIGSGIVAIIFLYLKRFDTSSIFLSALCLSVVCSPYAWPYDYVILIPVLITLWSQRSLLLNCSVVGLNSLFLIFPQEVSWTIWYPLSLLGILLSNYKDPKNSKVVKSLDNR